MDHEDTEYLGRRTNEVSRTVVDAVIEVHRELGPGLLESAYERALCYELSLRGMPYERQVELNVMYKGKALNPAYRLDIVVDDLVILELKSVSKIEPIHEAQLLSYLRLSRKWLGLLLNFNVPVMN
ncbi:MAG: GxxExxY protein [Gammaproteobacteria bacterium]|nr:GxxExxY protein [Gammaproteobacteria bacterium]